MGYPGEHGSPRDRPPRRDDFGTPVAGRAAGGGGSPRQGPPRDRYEQLDNPYGEGPGHSRNREHGYNLGYEQPYGQERAEYDDDGYDRDRYEESPDRHGLPPSQSARPPERSRRRTPLVIAGGVAGALALAVAGFAVSSALKSDDAPTAQPDPAASEPAPDPSPTVPPLDPVKLQSRDSDPTPLTLKEVFAKKSFKEGGVNYSRTAWKSGKCPGSVTGATFAAAIKKAGCTQALRASFQRSDGQLVGTVGIFNLKTQGTAKYAERAAAAKNAYLQPLAGSGHTRTLGRGEALGSAQARGHYLVLTWVQRPDGKKIPADRYGTVTTFGQHVLKGSNLAYALAYRETEGKPFTG